MNKPATIDKPTPVTEVADWRNLYQRIAAAMREVSYVQKEKKQGMRYSIVSHDDVTSKVRPALLANGVIYFISALSTQQDGNRTEAQGTIRFQNVDDPSDYICVGSFGYGIDEQDKGPGKAMSYMVKYALLKTLGLETGDDPDFDQETEHRSDLVNKIEAMIDIMDKTSANDTREALLNARTRLTPVSNAALSSKFAAKVKDLKEKEDA